MTDKILIKIENLEVQLPASHIIVKKDEYLDLKNKASQGQYMSLSEVLEMVSVSRPWILEHVLYQPDIRSKIDIEMCIRDRVQKPCSYYYTGGQQTSVKISLNK